jgi:hypothetical protein
MARTVIVGDIHGCTGELEELLEKIDFRRRRDRLVSVGDLVVRGPDPHGTLALVSKLGGQAVRGNHEDKLLAWRRRHKALGPDHQRLARKLSNDEWRMLEGLPLWLDLPEHGIRIVHAGVLPGTPIERMPPEALLKMRTIDARGSWSDDADGGVLWGTKYVGPPHIIFGHHARSEPQFHAWATGLDTGCVYGNRLTALVLDSREGPRRGVAVRQQLESVPAMRRYYGNKSGPLSR